MTDNDNLAAPPNFDTWRQAINESVKGRSEYKAIKASLKLLDPIKAVAAEFPSMVDQRLAGLDANSNMTKDMRDALSFAHDICGDPWRQAFITWAKESPDLAALIAKAKQNPKAFTYHGFIGDMCEAFGRALAAKGDHAVISPFYNAQTPDAVQYRARLADGTWKNIRQQDVVELARKPKGPHIVHSANHAFLDNEASDLDSLQNEFSKLFDGSRLPTGDAMPAQDTGHLSTWDKKNLGPNDTITVFATNTRENRFLNLAQLFHRLDEVDRAQANPKADTFKNAAPIAVDMVETLLKSIVIDGDVDKIKASRDANGKPVFFHSMISLRPDAIDIIRRQRYRGFSKGGNDFRDGMRLLVHALDAKDGRNLPLVQSSAGFTTHDLISNISMIVFGLNEKPMAEYYRELGVNVPIISSKNDTTAPPSIRHDDDEPAYNYKGASKNGDDGHSPSYSVDGMLADWRIHDLLRMHGAVSQGQAAITDVNFVRNADGSYDKNALSLEVAQGTSDAMMQKVIDPLNDALSSKLKAEGCGNAQVVRVGDGQSRDRYRLEGDGLVSPKNIDIVQDVLRSLSENHKAKTGKSKAARPEMPLWVSEATAYEKISGIKRYLILEEQGKLDQKTPYPISVIEPASVTERVRYANTQGLRNHDRVARGQEHVRIAKAGGDEKQLG